MRRSIRSWIVLTRWRRFLPRRSSFQTIGVSPSRSELVNDIIDMGDDELIAQAEHVFSLILSAYNEGFE
jgi:hypothetical protein